MDPCVVALSHLAQTLWALGFPDQAVRRSEEAINMAREIDHPPSQGLALVFSVYLHQYRRDAWATRRAAEEQIDFLGEQAMSPLWLSQATIMRGWALADEGDIEEGMAEMSRGLTAWSATGGGVYGGHYRALLAEARGMAGEVNTGLAVIAEALEIVEATGDRYWEAELHRLQGVLLLKLPTPDAVAAEARLRHALEVARHQSSRSLELRAATSLSRLWLSQEKRADARKLLADTYGWFTEGFDTRDLVEARALLAELSG